MNTEKQKELEMLREVTGDPTLEIVELDDTFDFKCQQCGQCCINRGDIIINPYDVYIGAKYLGITCVDFLQKYAVADYGGKSRIPMALLASDKKTGFCPLLKFDANDGGKFKCTVHGAKPGACRNHPIGIVTGMKCGENGADQSTAQMTFIKVSQCSNSQGHNNPQLVRDWVKTSLEHQEEVEHAHLLQSYVEKHFPARLFDVVMSIMGMQLPEDAPENLKEVNGQIKELKKVFYDLYLHYVYENFDTDRPFIEQVKENMEALDTMLEQPKLLLRHLCNEMPEGIKDAIKELTGDENIFAWAEKEDNHD